MTKTITVEMTVPAGLKAGDTFTAEVELPVSEKKPRGQLAGIELADMSDEQLKREKINAGSVLYKAKQRGASAETIAANEARVKAVTDEIEKRHPAATAAETPSVASSMDDAAPANAEI